MKYSFLLSTVPSGKAKTNPVDYIYEPDQEEIIKELIPKSLKFKL